MALSEAQKRAARKYRAGNLETVAFTVRKGTREFYKKASAALGLSQQEMLRRAAVEYIDTHSAETVDLAPRVWEKEKRTSRERQLLEEFHRMDEDLQQAVMKVIRAINAGKTEE